MGQKNLGHVPWNKGKTGVYSVETLQVMRTGACGYRHTDEAKERIRQANIGRPSVLKGTKQPVEQMRALALGNIGRVPWNKGLRRGLAQGFFDSTALTEWGQRVFKRDKYTCQDCGATQGGELEADHIISRWQDPTLVYTVANGRTLCRRCHKQTLTYGWKAVRRPVVVQLPLPLVM